MIFKWLDTSLVDKFAAEIADSLNSSFPASESVDPRRKSPARFKKIHAEIVRKAQDLAQRNPLNIYQKAKLGTVFKLKLFDAGYDRAFVDTLTLEIVAIFANAGKQSIGVPAKRSKAQEMERVEQFKIASKLLEDGEISKAELIAQSLLKSNSNDSAALFLLGNIRYYEKDFAQSAKYLEKSITLNPNEYGPKLVMGKLHLSNNELPLAEDYFKQVLVHKPDLASVHNLLGITLQMTSKSTEAITHFKLAIKHGAEASGHSNLGIELMKFGDSKVAISNLRRAMQLDPSSPTYANNYLFYLSHDESVQPKELFAAHTAFANQFERPLVSRWPKHTNGREHDRPLRIGFVSGDLYSHPVASFIEPVWNSIDRKQYAIYVYYNQTKVDEVTIRLRKKVDQWADVFELSDDALSEQIQRDKIDILFDLSGHTAHNRLLVFARKPAPIQVSWIGNPNTTGLKSMDYYLADPFSAPPGLLDNYFSEKIVQLPTGPLFSPVRDAPAVGALPSLSADVFTFGSFARPDKITTGTVSRWAGVLSAVRNSRMQLVGVSDKDQEKSIRANFQRFGIDEQRLIVIPRLELADYLAAHKKVDLALDTSPFAGGTTTCHAAWMGVPMLTLAGQTLSSRSGAIVNGILDLQEFTVGSETEFVSKAVYWRNNTDELAEIRRSLRARMQASSMLSPAVVCRQLESAMRTMWERWCDEKPAVSFQVETA